MTDSAQLVQSNWNRVQNAVQAAADESEWKQEVQVIGVSKYVDAPQTNLLVQAGCQELGENRPQVLWEKFDWFAQEQTSQPQWHMIGHLQRNKVRRTLPMLKMIHSVDSLRLAKTLEDEAAKIERKISILAEVNVTQDDSKTGMPESELSPFLEQIADMPHLELRGLMAMSTHFAGGDQARAEFARVRELRDRLQFAFPQFDLRELSMGMSGDFREAILEGATLVRIGSSLWEGIR
ncbi:MAG: YggS family pyridoxal phosphate-dependent enzyme [Planctomycetota bacterium]